MSCCPPGSLPFLASDYNHTGSCCEVTSRTSVYESVQGTSQKALIIIPDIWGWNGGRTRNIADYYAQRGWHVVVPKILTPSYQGGTDGDGFPPDYNPDATFMDYMKSLSWEETFKPRVSDIKSYLQGKGILKIAMIGFCFGGYVVAKTFADPELGDALFVGGVIPHPSIQLEQFAYGGDAAALVASVSQPTLLLPAGNDSDAYDKGGNWCPPNAESVRFPDMSHGWVPRGNMSDEKVAAGVTAALDAMTAFLDKL